MVIGLTITTVGPNRRNINKVENYVAESSGNE
jgi:hypothetical protein